MRFELHLQPIMNIADGRISSAEVLLRLRDQGELVPPSAARPHRRARRADASGGAWVDDNSLEMLVRRRGGGPPPVPGDESPEPLTGIPGGSETRVTCL